ncbi:MAG: hypothetical protein PVJ57_02815 [Phycisphaerae bacterium]|jgi:probable HAF family extracellular repeat protein
MMQLHKLNLSRWLTTAIALLAVVSVCADDIEGIWEIPSDGSRSQVFDVNNHGQVVGTSYTASGTRMAYLWDNGTMTDLLAGQTGVTQGLAWGINNNGQVAGWYGRTSGDNRGFSWDAGAVTTLNPPGNSSTCWSEGMGINDAGVIVGSYETGGSPEFAACTWQVGQSEPSSLIPAVPGSVFYSGHRINNLGQTTGYWMGDGPWRAYAFDGETSKDLGTIGESDWCYAEAWGINDSGQIVGYSDLVPDEIIHATLWEQGNIIDMGHLGGNYSFAWDINNLGVAVGVSSTDSGQTHAFIWEDGVMTDLNDFLPAGSGWVLREGIAISDTGWIAGNGTYNGQNRGFVLLIPEPTSFLSIVLGTLALLRRR